MVQSPMPSASHSASGALLLSFGLFLFAVQDVIIKWLSGGYAVMQIVFIRSTVAMAILLVVLYWFFQPHRRRLKKFWPIGIKASSAFLSYTSYYMAMSQLPIADVATITFSAPIMVTAMSVVLFREQVGIRRRRTNRCMRRGRCPRAPAGSSRASARARSRACAGTSILPSVFLRCRSTRATEIE